VALIEAMLGLSRLGADAGDRIAELDVNPLIVRREGHGPRAVDALVVLCGAAARRGARADFAVDTLVHSL
jgi:acetyltransferase